MISMHNLFPECQSKHNNTIDETKQVAQVKSVTRSYPKINNILKPLSIKIHIYKYSTYLSFLGEIGVGGNTPGIVLS